MATRLTNSAGLHGRGVPLSDVLSTNPELLGSAKGLFDSPIKKEKEVARGWACPVLVSGAFPRSFAA
jgi:hypothetical protein